ncbi:hypothetical protein ENBRE01_2356 [Enteropsectra breve]|nr:hypothetical protein ENBRE01_2356 [Enteropsectra breve]
MVSYYFSFYSIFVVHYCFRSDRELDPNYPSVVSNIKKKLEIILAAISSRSLKPEKIKTSKCAIIDEKLFEWFSSLRQENVQINGGLLLEKAQKIADELGLDGFVCNLSWINRFKK